MPDVVTLLRGPQTHPMFTCRRCGFEFRFIAQRHAHERLCTSKREQQRKRARTAAFAAVFTLLVVASTIGALVAAVLP